MGVESGHRRLIIALLHQGGSRGPERARDLSWITHRKLILSPCPTAFHLPGLFWLVSRGGIMSLFIVGKAQSRVSPPGAYRSLHLLNVQDRAFLTGFLSLDMGGWWSWPSRGPSWAVLSLQVTLHLHQDAPNCPAAPNQAGPGRTKRNPQRWVVTSILEKDETEVERRGRDVWGKCRYMGGGERIPGRGCSHCRTRPVWLSRVDGRKGWGSQFS